MTNFATSFILPNSTPFDIIRTFVHTLLTVPDPRELVFILRLQFSTGGLAPGIFNSFFGTFEKTQLQIEHSLEHLAKWHCPVWHPVSLAPGLLL